MDLIIIAGFLGSGKTTVLLSLAKKIAEERRIRIAVIENEVGKIGIDDQAVRGEGLPVREIYSGCICCSLRSDLITTLLELEREYRPELVILEPSGVAAPRLVKDVFMGYGGEIGVKKLVVLFDVTRVETLKSFALPFVHGGIEAADLVALNKIDDVDEEAVPAYIGALREINPHVEIIPVSALLGTNMEMLIDKMLEGLSVSRVESGRATRESDAHEMPHVCREEHDHSHGEDEQLPNASVCAADVSIALREETSSAQILEDGADMLEQIVEDLKAAGCTMIGHIKAIIKDKRSGYALLSVTDFGKKAVAKGALAKKTGEVALRINAIVFGIDSGDLLTLIRTRILTSRLAKRGKIESSSF